MNIFLLNFDLVSLKYKLISVNWKLISIDFKLTQGISSPEDCKFYTSCSKHKQKYILDVDTKPTLLFCRVKNHFWWLCRLVSSYLHWMVLYCVISKNTVYIGFCAYKFKRFPKSRWDAQKATQWNGLFCLMHMQRSLLCPFWVACFKRSG